VDGIARSPQVEMAQVDQLDAVVELADLGCHRRDHDLTSVGCADTAMEALVAREQGGYLSAT
jgi:hypothetical protein